MAKDPSAKDPATGAERTRQRSRSRRERQRAELRAAILDAAGGLFLERGYEGFSLRRVAEEIGYSPTTIYLHFSDKDELLFEVAMEGFARFNAALREAYASTDHPLGRLEALGRAYLAFGLAHPAHYRLMFMQRGDFTTRVGSRNQQPLVESEGFGALFRAVEEAQRAGALRPGDALAYANTLWAGVHGIVALAISMPFCTEVQAQEMADVFFPMIGRGLAA